MIKVLHIRSSFNPGGTETLLLNLYNYKQDRIKFYFVFIRGGKYVSKLNNNSNVYFEFYRKLFLDLNVLKKLYSVVKENDITILHTHQEIELLYAVILKFFKPTIKIFHSIHLTNQHYNFDHYFEKFLTRFANKILPVSMSLKNHLIKKGYPLHKLFTLYNSVSLPANVDEHKIRTFKELIKYSTDDYIILMTGNFRPEKDQLTVVKAFNRLREKYLRLKLVFIGQESNETAACKNITNADDLNKRVFYLGSLEDAWIYLKVCNLFVFSSLSETFGIAVIESLLMKTPVLASDIDIMKELSVNEKYFSLFETGNEKHLAEKIEWFIKNENIDSVKEKIYSAYNYALSKFSYDTFVNNLADIYCG